jgi:hypothetical protein
VYGPALPLPRVRRFPRLKPYAIRR